MYQQDKAYEKPQIQKKKNQPSKMTKYPQKVIVKIYHQKHILKWTNTVNKWKKNNKIYLKKSNIYNKSREQQWKQV